MRRTVLITALAVLTTIGLAPTAGATFGGRNGPTTGPYIPQSQKAVPRPGEGLSGADRAWLSLRQTTPRLGEGLTGADRSWLAASSPTVSSPEPHVALPPSGFDWGAAGIGAGIAAAVLLVVTGSAVAIRRRVSPAH